MVSSRDLEVITLGSARLHEASNCSLEEPADTLEAKALGPLNETQLHNHKSRAPDEHLCIEM